MLFYIHADECKQRYKAMYPDSYDAVIFDERRIRQLFGARCLRSEIKYATKVKYANQNHSTTPQSSTGSNDVIDCMKKQKTWPPS